MGLFHKKEIGNAGENTALLFLKKNKYKILDTNFSAKTGEIDIICQNKDFIVFVEVKTRKKGTQVTGVYAVDKKKQLHIIKTADIYLKKHKCKKQPRFDIIEVEFDSSGVYYVTNHYVDAFKQGGAYAIF